MSDTDDDHKLLELTQRHGIDLGKICELIVGWHRKERFADPPSFRSREGNFLYSRIIAPIFGMPVAPGVKPLVDRRGGTSSLPDIVAYPADCAVAGSLPPVLSVIGNDGLGRLYRKGLRMLSTRDFDGAVCAFRRGRERYGFSPGAELGLARAYCFGSSFSEAGLVYHLLFMQHSLSRTMVVEDVNYFVERYDALRKFPPSLFSAFAKGLLAPEYAAVCRRWLIKLSTE